MEEKLMFAVIGLFYDFRDFQEGDIQEGVSLKWLTRAPIEVEKVSRNAFIFFCHNGEDRDKLAALSTACYKGALMVFKKWIPNSSLMEYDFSWGTLWVKIEGLPLHINQVQVASNLLKRFGSVVYFVGKAKMDDLSESSDFEEDVKDEEEEDGHDGDNDPKPNHSEEEEGDLNGDPGPSRKRLSSFNGFNLTDSSSEFGRPSRRRRLEFCERMMKEEVGFPSPSRKWKVIWGEQSDQGKQRRENTSDHHALTETPSFLVSGRSRPGHMEGIWASSWCQMEYLMRIVNNINEERKEAGVISAPKKHGVDKVKNFEKWRLGRKEKLITCNLAHLNIFLNNNDRLLGPKFPNYDPFAHQNPSEIDDLGYPDSPYSSNMEKTGRDQKERIGLSRGLMPSPNWLGEEAPGAKKGSKTIGSPGCSLGKRKITDREEFLTTSSELADCFERRLVLDSNSSASDETHRLNMRKQEAIARACRSWCLDRKKKLGITWDLFTEELDKLEIRPHNPTQDEELRSWKWGTTIREENILKIDGGWKETRSGEIRAAYGWVMERGNNWIQDKASRIFAAFPLQAEAHAMLEGWRQPVATY
ncbi:Serine hydroxymethyltransferase 2 [Bienertia sinuspersici]